VLFGQKDDSTLLGVVSLEALGLILDPLKRELRSLPMVLGASPRPDVLEGRIRLLSVLIQGYDRRHALPPLKPRLPVSLSERLEYLL
jgi:hypothetical protein